jgi:hypothetical protein
MTAPDQIWAFDCGDWTDFDQSEELWDPHEPWFKYLRATPAREAADDLLAALDAADAHFGPFAEITINGAHDPDDVRVVALIRAAIARAKGGAA